MSKQWVSDFSRDKGLTPLETEALLSDQRLKDESERLRKVIIAVKNLVASDPAKIPVQYIPATPNAAYVTNPPQALFLNDTTLQSLGDAGLTEDEIKILAPKNDQAGNLLASTGPTGAIIYAKGPLYEYFEIFRNNHQVAQDANIADPLDFASKYTAATTPLGTTLQNGVQANDSLMNAIIDIFKLDRAATKLTKALFAEQDDSQKLNEEALDKEFYSSLPNELVNALVKVKSLGHRELDKPSNFYDLAFQDASYEPDATTGQHKITVPFGNKEEAQEFLDRMKKVEFSNGAEVFGADSAIDATDNKNVILTDFDPNNIEQLRKYSNVTKDNERNIRDRADRLTSRLLASLAAPFAPFTSAGALVAQAAYAVSDLAKIPVLSDLLATASDSLWQLSSRAFNAVGLKKASVFCDERRNEISDSQRKTPFLDLIKGKITGNDKSFSQKFFGVAGAVLSMPRSLCSTVLAVSGAAIGSAIKGVAAIPHLIADSVNNIGDRALKAAKANYAKSGFNSRTRTLIFAIASAVCRSVSYSLKTVGVACDAVASPFLSLASLHSKTGKDIVTNINSAFSYPKASLKYRGEKAEQKALALTVGSKIFEGSGGNKILASSRELLRNAKGLSFKKFDHHNQVKNMPEDLLFTKLGTITHKDKKYQIHGAQDGHTILIVDKSKVGERAFHLNSLPQAFSVNAGDIVKVIDSLAKKNAQNRKEGVSIKQLITQQQANNITTKRDHVRDLVGVKKRSDKKGNSVDETGRITDRFGREVDPKSVAAFEILNNSNPTKSPQSPQGSPVETRITSHLNL